MHALAVGTLSKRQLHKPQADGVPHTFLFSTTILAVTRKISNADAAKSHLWATQLEFDSFPFQVKNGHIFCLFFWLSPRTKMLICHQQHLWQASLKLANHFGCKRKRLDAKVRA